MMQQSDDTAPSLVRFQSDCFELDELGDRVLEVSEKPGLNAFSNTELADILHDRNIQHVIFAGAATSTCVDSSARSAIEGGLEITVLAGRTVGRTGLEQRFYEKETFPTHHAKSHEIFPEAKAEHVARATEHRAALHHRST